MSCVRGAAPPQGDCVKACPGKHSGEKQPEECPHAGVKFSFTDAVHLNHIGFILAFVLTDMFLWLYTCIRSVKIDFI